MMTIGGPWKALRIVQSRRKGGVRFADAAELLCEKYELFAPAEAMCHQLESTSACMRHCVRFCFAEGALQLSLPHWWARSVGHGTRDPQAVAAKEARSWEALRRPLAREP
jgi:hypothetical protein